MDFIDNHLITDFSEFLLTKAQQKESMLASKVMTKQIVGDVFAFDSITTEHGLPQEHFERHPKKTISDVVHERRKIVRRRFSHTLAIDNSDVRGILSDPQGAYIETLVDQFNRQKDHVIYDALFADVQTGRDFTTTKTFVGEGGTTVNATAGFTYDILREIRKTFRSRSVIGEDILIGFTEKEEDQLLNENKLINMDFVGNRPVENGQLINPFGFQLVTFPTGAAAPVIKSPTGNVECFAVSTKGVCFGLSKDISIDIVEAKETTLESVYITVKAEFGAVRTDARRVIKVDTTA